MDALSMRYGVRAKGHPTWNHTWLVRPARSDLPYLSWNGKW